MGKFAKDGKDLICPVCNCGAKLIDDKEIYGKHYGLMWVCQNHPKCDYRVGCHKGTTIPLGEMAADELRKWRHKVHEKLDPLWKNHKYNRGELYQELGIKFNKMPFHTAELQTVQECKDVISFIHDFYE